MQVLGGFKEVLSLEFEGEVHVPWEAGLQLARGQIISVEEGSVRNFRQGDGVM